MEEVAMNRGERGGSDKEEGAEESAADTESKSIAMNGVAHVVLSVRDMAASAAFYRELCGRILGMVCVLDHIGPGSPYGSPFLYHVGGRTAIGICPARSQTPHSQWNAGLHHVCLRLRSRQEVDRFHGRFVQTLVPLGGRVVHGPEDGEWAPGYRSALFEDPDGIRIEVNFVPLRGLLGMEKPALFAKL
eukprot:TRINITY_DN11240_c0_g1_i1.p2 TRINITY_DN11240_c0_g1~~TRINITY_DN11240_c0_g1_i1.p2  ORF type:complete len:189 (-),score=45.64 TRINITY_DN11240_c0_g1_i1:36-602(-)